MSEINYKVIDKFLPKDVFLNLKKHLLSDSFSWFYNTTVAYKGVEDKEKSIYFTHLFFNIINNSEAFILVKDILEKIDLKSIIRVKANLYPKTNKLIVHDNHVDFKFKHKGLIYYINTNNGLTILKNKIKIKSIENRALFFEPHIEHCSTTCTDEKIRVNINFNYF